MTQEQFREVVQSMSEVAQLCSNYYQELIRCGFTEQQALQLTMGFQANIINGNKNNET